MTDLRQLDRLVATGVFGWAVVNGDSIWKGEEDSGGHPLTLGLPCFSSSIADAWLVVEKMRDHRLFNFTLRSSNDGMHAEFDNPTNGQAYAPLDVRLRLRASCASRFSAEETAAAICLAALAALGVEVPT